MRVKKDQNFCLKNAIFGKKKFFIKIMSSFNNSPHNGCRKRKVRRKKNLKKRRDG